MKYRRHFESTIDSMRGEGRYRVFTDMERNPERWRGVRFDVVKC